MQLQPKNHLRAVDAAIPVHVRPAEPIMKILSEPLPAWQVKKLIPRRSTVMLFGDSQSGKTFLALALAACVSTGRPFMDLQTRAGAVLYIAAEGNGGLGKRIRALASKYPDLAAAPFYVIRQAVNIREWLVEVLTRASDIMDEHGELGLIVIDTLSQTIFGDENGREAADYIAATTRLADETGAPVVIVHHIGKDSTRGARGSSALRGNVDVAIRVAAGDADNRSATTRPAEQGKARDGAEITFGFRLRQIEVGLVDGEEETSCFVEQIADDEIAERRERLAGGDQHLLYRIAGDLAKSAGEAGKTLNGGRPAFMLADLEAAWKSEKVATGQAKKGAPSYCGRALQALIEKGYIAQAGDQLWFT